MPYCETFIERSMYRPGEGYQCSRDAIGQCVECTADICSEHGSPCPDCRKPVCDDHLCSQSHMQTCKAGAFSLLNEFVESIHTFLDFREQDGKQ